MFCRGPFFRRRFAKVGKGKWGRSGVKRTAGGHGGIRNLLLRTKDFKHHSFKLLRHVFFSAFIIVFGVANINKVSSISSTPALWPTLRQHHRSGSMHQIQKRTAPMLQIELHRQHLAVLICLGDSSFQYVYNPLCLTFRQGHVRMHICEPTY